MTINLLYFPVESVPQYIKINTFRRLCNDDLERSYFLLNNKHLLFYLKLHIMSNFPFYLKPLL